MAQQIAESAAAGDAEAAAQAEVSKAVLEAERSVLEADLGQLQLFAATDDVLAGPGEQEFKT